MKAREEHLIIHIFALLHALTVIGCRLAGFPDEYLLTLLTITMIVLICGQREVRMVATSCCIVFGNLAGYLLGVAIASLIGLMDIPDLLVFSISTIITTELLGWLACAACSIFDKSTQDITVRDLMWMALTCILVYTVRIVLSICHNHGIFANIVQYNKYEDAIYFLVSFCTMTVLVAITMIMYVISERHRVSREKEKRHLAQFRYMKLNQQVNPHFLFNSLNVLDCLVADGENDKAGTYIHKLSKLYRYMLSNEEEVIVRLGDEMDFVRQYIDLMQIRFPEGLEVNISLPSEMMNAGTVPCSVQLLIENATKHNSISKSVPLHITVSAPDSGHIRVSNNLCPKLTPVSSTGMGLKYIRQQYQDLSGRDISVVRTDTDFTVTLPLIRIADK